MMSFRNAVRTTLALAAVLLALSVQAQTGVDEDIQELANEWTRAYNRHDGEALSGLYREDAAVMLHGDAVIRGRDQIREYWEQDFQEGNPITVLLVTHAIEGVDMMLVHGNYQVIERDDGTPLSSGRFAHIWFLGNDGEWRIDRDLWYDAFDPYVFDPYEQD